MKKSNKFQQPPTIPLSKIKETKSFKPTSYSTHPYFFLFKLKMRLCFNVYTGINSYLCEKQISGWQPWLLNIGRRETSDICRSPCHICPTDSCRSVCIPSRRCRTGSLRIKGRLREGAACCTYASILTARVHSLRN